MYVTPFLPIPDCADCGYQRKRHIAARVYFALACINFVFVVITSMIYFYRTYRSNKLMRRAYSLQEGRLTLAERINHHTLGQRSMFGLLTLTIGHLILSTAVLMYQSFSEASCELLLWGTLTGYYTWMFGLCWCSYHLYHLIRINRMKRYYAERSREHEWQEWFIRHKRRLKARDGLMPYSIILVLIVTLVAVIELANMVRNGAECYQKWGTYLMLVLAGIFVVVVVPFSVWHVFKYKDLHGIRSSILTQCIVGVPCAVMYFIWIGTLEPPGTERPSMVRVMFAPGNWILIMTTTGHIMYIVLPLFRHPVFQRLSVTSSQFRQPSPHDCPSMNSNTIQSSNAGSQDAAEMSSSLNVELSAESLRNALNDSCAADMLLQLATKDFSAENVLFYTEYLKLAHAQPLRWSDCYRLYKTYIPDTAPLQINITDRARKGLEAIFNNSRSGGAGVAGNSSGSGRPGKSHREHQENISIEIFDPAREEVFWNIFTSVFPKFVQNHQH